MNLIEWLLIGIFASIWIIGLGFWFSIRDIGIRLVFVDHQTREIKNKLS
jgi:hypothetical protein